MFVYVCMCVCVCVCVCGCVILRIFSSCLCDLSKFRISRCYEDHFVLEVQQVVGLVRAVLLVILGNFCGITRTTFPVLVLTDVSAIEPSMLQGSRFVFRICNRENIRDFLWKILQEQNAKWTSKV